MNKIHYASAGFVSFYVLQIINYLHAYINGAPQLIDKSFYQLIAIVIIMGLPVALLGSLIGLVFKFIQLKMLGINIYLQSIFFFVTTNAVFFLPKGAHAYMSSDFLFSSLYSVPGGVIFVLALQTFSKTSSKTKQTT